MNLFAMSDCPVQSAIWIDNKRLPKMLLECAQMMATAMHEYGVPHAYRPTHVNHPSAVWMRQSRDHWAWCLEHMDALHSEMLRRFGTLHKSMLHFDVFDDFGVNCLPAAGFVPHANCTDFKHIDNVHTAYRHHLISKWNDDVHNWQRKVSWGPLTDAPPWVVLNNDRFEYDPAKA